jgi:hypothetical protein
MWRGVNRVKVMMEKRRGNNVRGNFSLFKSHELP